MGMKLGIVGAGAVGTACIISLIPRNIAREIVVVDKNAKRAIGVVADIQYGATLDAPVMLRHGDFSDLAGAAIVIVTAGVNEKTGGATSRGDAEGRLHLLGTNADVYRDIIPKITASAPEAILLIVTDPPDPLADLARILSGHGRVLSTGTFLDSLRFQFHLSQRLSVSPRAIQAWVIGEHGTSEVFLWSSARVAGTPLARVPGKVDVTDKSFQSTLEKDVRFANIAIIEGIGASQFGIGRVVSRICEIILRDERAIIPVGTYHGEFGVTLSLPSVLGRNGVDRVLLPDMNPAENAALLHSADVLRKAVARVAS
jgi:L-lactate dehydrogenase